MKASVARTGLFVSRAVAEVAWGSGDAHVQSTATRRPRLQAVGARATPHFPFGFAAKPSPSAPWARGLLSVFWERGSPDLPACGLCRGSSGGPVRPIFINSSSRPSRGAKPRRADDARLPQERPLQAGLRGGAEIKAIVPREVPVTQAMTIETRREPASVVSSFLVWCKGGKRRRGVPMHQAKVSIAVHRDQDKQDGRAEVIAEPTAASPPEPLAGEDYFCQDSLY